MNSTSKPSRPSVKSASRRAAPVAEHRDVAQSWLLAAFVMVCVARPLVPSEAVSWIGDGHPFTIVLLLIAAGYLMLAAWRGRFTRPFGLVDAGVAALVLLCVTSAALGALATLYGAGNNSEFDARICSPRLAINMLWEWVGLGLVFFLARQLIATRLEARAVVAVMIALAAALAALGLWQEFVTLPAERAVYAASPDEALREIDQWFPPGSPERARFEDRLNSTEPTATFALANSLAGYLATWLVVGLGVGWSLLEIRPDAGRVARYLRLALAGGCLALMLVCLVLTKSRTAYLAVAAGAVLLPLVDVSFRRMIRWKVVVFAAVVLAVAIGAGVAVGGLDSEVLTEAAKSLEYRVQYWQATLDVIANYPVLGIGPGEFQDYYTQYKLPQASEEVRDPHNFLLETWATAGTIAFLALVLVLAYFAWQTWELAESPEGAAPSAETMWFVAGGGAAGVLFAYGAGLPFGFSLSLAQVALALVSGAAAVGALWTWIAGGSLPLRLPALGVCVLLINLSAAGGFTFPGVAGTFWLLLALGLNVGSPPSTAAAARPRLRWAPIGGAVLAVAAILACYQTAFLPVLACRAAMAKGFDQTLSEQQRLDALLAATIADPYSAEPWMALAQLALGHLRQEPESEYWGRRFVSATASVGRLRGHSSATWQHMASWYRELYDLYPNADLAERVVETARSAAVLYPTSAMLQGEYALALANAGKAEVAEQTARLALELDAATPHADKKLSTQLRERLEAIVAKPKPAEPTPEPAQGIK